MADQHFHEQFFMDKLLQVLQLDPEEEKALQNFITIEGTEAFFERYSELALAPDTQVKIKALVALLEARYEE